MKVMNKDKGSSGSYGGNPGGKKGANDGLNCSYTGEQMTAMRMREIGGGDADKTPAKNPGNLNYAYTSGVSDGSDY